MLTKQENDLSEAELNEAVKYAHRYAIGFCRQRGIADVEEISSWAVQGAWEAWKRFDAKRGSAWKQWGAHYIHLYALKGLEQINRQHRLPTLSLTDSDTDLFESVEDI